MTVRIMIAEDQTMVRQALVALLEPEPDFEVVAQAPDGDEALGRFAAGDRVFDPSLAAAALAQGESTLTDRESEVLTPAASHHAVTDIAARLHLSPGTMRNHLSAAIQKLAARNRAEAVEIAQHKGWL